MDTVSFIRTRIRTALEYDTPQWISSYDVASELGADLTYVQHCLREADDVERFAYNDGFYMAYPGAHLVLQKGTRSAIMTIPTRPSCPCCYLTVTTMGLCPLD